LPCRARNLALAARQAELEIQDELARIAEAIAKLHIPADVLTADEAIRALFEEKSAIQKSRKDCDRRVAELAELNRTTIASLPAVPDTSGLAALVNRARRELDVANPRELRSKIAAAEKTVQLALRGLSLWNGSDEDLEALPVPEVETVEECRTEFQEANAAEGSARGKLAEANNDLAARQSERERIVGLDSVPTLLTLADARELRDFGWTAIKRVWKEAAENVAEERDFLARTSQTDLAVGYEGAVAGADHVSDHIREEAERVSQPRHDPGFRDRSAGASV
jgi:hypothetical protein